MMARHPKFMALLMLDEFCLGNEQDGSAIAFASTFCWDRCHKEYPIADAIALPGANG